MSLKQKICQHIELNGPIGIDQYMEMVLGDPDHGYYMTRDPFGENGDFTTAPEISQMFGEMIGMWAASLWIEMGKPEMFYLVECGPGRGTLMADVMRATKNIEGFREAANIHLLEISPVLKKIQKETLKDFLVNHHESVDTLPKFGPIILIANEFLDALPIKQFQKTTDGWAERVIGLEGTDELSIGLKPTNEVFTVSAEEGSVFEVSPARNNFVAKIDEQLSTKGGGALFLDYGHTVSTCIDTLQAVKGHEHVDVLYEPGHCDLTSHVDFEPFGYECMSQADFLKDVGLIQRAETLKTTASKVQKADIDLAVERLTSHDEMGDLFKVMQIAYRHMPKD